MGGGRVGVIFIEETEKVVESAQRIVGVESNKGVDSAEGVGREVY